MLEGKTVAVVVPAYDEEGLVGATTASSSSTTRRGTAPRTPHARPGMRAWRW
jgi:hypothetical protein